MPVNPPAMSTSMVAPTVTVASARVSLTVGAAGCTVTARDCVALPVAFAATTVTVADPAATPVRVTTDPSTVTVTVAASPLVAL